MDKLRSSSDVTVLRNRVSRFLNNDGNHRAPLTALLRRFSEHRLSAVIFGGTLRDLMVGGFRATPRDVDIVVDGVSTEELAKLFQDVVVRRTRFGGLHLNVKGWMVDVWPLSETWALRELRIGERDFEALTRTTFLNVEAVIVDLTVERGRREVYSGGFFESIRSSTVDINLEENPFPELSTIRTLVTASKLNYGISTRLARYLIHHIDKTPIEQFVDIQLGHYGCVKLNTAVIYAWSKIIRRQVSTQPIVRIPYIPSQLPLWEDDRARLEAA